MSPFGLSPAWMLRMDAEHARAVSDRESRSEDRWAGCVTELARAMFSAAGRGEYSCVSLLPIAELNAYERESFRRRLMEMLSSYGYRCVFNCGEHSFAVEVRW